MVKIKLLCPDGLSSFSLSLLGLISSMFTDISQVCFLSLNVFVEHQEQGRWLAPGALCWLAIFSVCLIDLSSWLCPPPSQSYSKIYFTCSLPISVTTNPFIQLLGSNLGVTFGHSLSLTSQILTIKKSCPQCITIYPNSSPSLAIYIAIFLSPGGPQNLLIHSPPSALILLKGIFMPFLGLKSSIGFLLTK